MGPEFLIEVRYSQIMTFFFITMIYSAGMPALYVISFLQFFSMYWFDKFLFLRLYRTPPRYGIELSDKSRNIMQWAIATHMAIGFYMFSNNSIFTISSSYGMSFSMDSLGDSTSLISA